MGTQLRLAATLAALLALPALPADQTASCKESGSEYEGSCAQAIDKFAWDVLIDWKERTLESTRRLGRVQDEKMRHEPNEVLPGTTLEIRTFVFDGLLIEGWNDAGTIRARRIEIESPKWRVRGGLGVGCSVDAIRKALGTSGTMIGSVLKYGGMTEYAEFTLSAGKVTKVVVTFYTG